MEKFTELGKVPEGELVMKFPGTDIKMQYTGGTMYLNEEGTIGQLELEIRKIVGAEAGEVKGMAGTLGRQLMDQLANPEIQEMMDKYLEGKNHYLFYSKISDGEIVTMPGASGDWGVNDDHIDGMTIAIYGTQGGLPSVEQVYSHHLSAVNGEELLSGDVVEKGVAGLPQKCNMVYEISLELMNDF